MSPYNAGYFYCPYIPLQFIAPRSKQEKLKLRKEYLLSCPSAPYSCTGECKSHEYYMRVQDILLKEFGE